MKKTTFKTKSSFLALLFMIAIASSSCNRGVGCPTNFSISDFTQNAVEQVVDAFLYR